MDGPRFRQQDFPSKTSTSPDQAVELVSGGHWALGPFLTVTALLILINKQALELTLFYSDAIAEASGTRSEIPPTNGLLG